MEKTRRLGKEGESSLAITLAEELASASRAAGRASAVAWGTRILWGGVLGGALARSLGGSANVAETIALISLILAFIVGVAVWRKKSADVPKGTRLRAMLAARRLERRFPEQTGVWVAGVDFCCDLESKNAKTSADLRDATITLAARRLATVAGETDVENWRAILTEESGELFRNPRQKTVLCVLGVWINLALWGSAAVWEVRGSERRETFSLIGEATCENDGRDDKNKGNNWNKEIKENKEEKTIASFCEGEENKEARDGEIDAASTVGEPVLSDDILTALEILISELIQNSEIAEVLEAELENAADERTGAEKSGISGDATRFLLLARELDANLTRAKTGILARVRRLEATLRREQTTILKRLGKTGKIGEIGGAKDGDKDVEIKNIGKIKENGNKKNGVAGKDVALCLLASRLNEFEAKICVAETQEIASALGLSVVLRLDSASERAKTLRAAARRAGEWAKVLRREATAAQILRESWIFDATSRAWTAASETTWQKNQTLLACFAGRSARAGAAIDGADVAFENAKEGFVDAWSKMRSLEKERFAIVERTMERLQAESAEEFVDSVGAEKVLPGGDLLGNDDWDAAAWRAINDAASTAEKRESLILEAFENNRFGIVAEELQTKEKRLNVEPPPIETTLSESEGNDGEVETDDANFLIDDAFVSVDEKEVNEGKKRGVNGDARGRKERRRAFLAARLTFGVDGETASRCEAQTLLMKKVEAEDNALDEDASSRRASEKKEQSDMTARQENETRIAETKEEQNDATSLEVAKGRVPGNKFADKEINAENISGYDGKEDAGKKQGQTKGKLVASRPVDNESRSGGEANVDGAASGGEDGGTQVDENKAFNGELPREARRRFEGTSAPEIMPEHAEKIRLYRRRIAEEPKDNVK